MSSNAKLIETIKADFTKRLDTTKTMLEQWSVRLNQDPLYWLESSDGMFEKAATLRVLREIATSLEKGQSTADIHRRVLGHALHGARYPGGHSSATASLAKACLTAAYAQEEEILRTLLQLEGE